MVLPVLVTLAIILLVAFLVETLVEFVFADVFLQIPGAAQFKWTVKYIAIAVAVYAAFWYRFDLVALLSAFLDSPQVEISTFGMIITGVAIGKGSNYLHDLIDRFFKPAEQVLDEGAS